MNVRFWIGGVALVGIALPSLALARTSRLFLRNAPDWVLWFGLILFLGLFILSIHVYNQDKKALKECEENPKWNSLIPLKRKAMKWSVFYMVLSGVLLLLSIFVVFLTT